MAVKSLLYVNVAGCPQLPSKDALSIFAHGVDVTAVTDLTAAHSVLASNPGLTCLVSNCTDRALFEASRAQNPKRSHILVTDKAMDEYSVQLGGHEDTLLDHVIAHRTATSWLNDELRVTIQKLMTGDIFGIEKYLSQDCDVHRIQIASSGSREQYNSQVYRFAEDCRLGAHIAKSVWGISEEMLMNAIYDAPAAAGITRFLNMPRTTRVELFDHERSTLSFACDGDYFIIAVEDPFGLMTKEKLNAYAKKVLRRADSNSIIDSKAGGAGLGLFKILYSSHALVFNVEEKKRTEIMAIIEINEQLRDFGKMPRSLHFFRAT